MGLKIKKNKLEGTLSLNLTDLIQEIVENNIPVNPHYDSNLEQQTKCINRRNLSYSLKTKIGVLVKKQGNGLIYQALKEYIINNYRL